MSRQIDAGTIREFLNRNSAMVTVGAVVLLMISLGIMFWQMNGGSSAAIPDAYYYNMNTGELFVDSIAEVGPIAPPDGSSYDKYPWGLGPAGVRAYVFSCDDCSDESTRFIGYLETLPVPIAEKLKAANEDPAQAGEFMFDVESQTLVMSPEDPQKRWVPQASQPGQMIVSRIMQRCRGDQKLTVCFPE